MRPGDRYTPNRPRKRRVNWNDLSSDGYSFWIRHIQSFTNFAGEIIGNLNMARNSFNVAIGRICP